MSGPTEFSCGWQCDLATENTSPADDDNLDCCCYSITNFGDDWSLLCARIARSEGYGATQCHSWTTL
jgi:hypothetical protein